MPKKFTIDDMQEYAKDKGGKCLSKEYVDSSSPLKWRCEKGHTFDADFQIIRQGGWCKQCMNGNRRNEGKLELMKALAKERGGELLTETYTGNRVKMLWECKEGHQWSANAFNIKRVKSWCPECSGKLPLTIEDMKKDAAKHGGLCLSDKYESVNSKLKWQCSEGHVWISKVNNIRSGKWCHICAHKR